MLGSDNPSTLLTVTSAVLSSLAAAPGDAACTRARLLLRPREPTLFLLRSGSIYRIGGRPEGLGDEDIEAVMCTKERVAAGPWLLGGECYPVELA